MKTILLILMAILLAGNSAYAQTRMGDAEMKALLAGTWTSDCTLKTAVFNADGTDDLGERWDIKDGVLIELPADAEDRKSYFKILLLTKHEFLAQGMSVHAHGYLFYWRKDETSE